MKAIVLVMLVLVTAGCVITRAPHAIERPRWRLIHAADWDGGCVHGRAWVRKSGKAGVGMAVELRSRTDCDVVIAGADLVLADGARVPAGIRAVPALRGRSLRYTWLAFPFDNNAAWNRRVVDGAFELAILVEGRPAPLWRMSAQQL